MQRFYLVPIETNVVGGTQYRGPKYFGPWRNDPDPPALVQSPWAVMDYGFVPYGLLVAKDINQTDHDALVLNIDVYAFPLDLDGPVNDLAIDAFFEAINIPTDWLTPATTYRELMRQLAGMFQFNQRYAGISRQNASVFDNADLSTRLREMTAQEQEWFYQTVESFGYSRDLVNDNAQLRQLVKQAGDFWAGQTFYLGGVAF